MSSLNSSNRKSQCKRNRRVSLQVESLVTRPVEGVLNGVGNLESIRSESIQGLSVVTAIFKEGTDIHVARQMLAENLAELSGELPAGVLSPKMSPLTSSTMGPAQVRTALGQIESDAIANVRRLDDPPEGLMSVPGVASSRFLAARSGRFKFRCDRIV